jgi:hypothetical protein
MVYVDTYDVTNRIEGQVSGHSGCTEGLKVINLGSLAYVSSGDSRCRRFRRLRPLLSSGARECGCVLAA